MDPYEWNEAIYEIYGRYKERNEKRCCATCMWHDGETGVCCNGDSYWAADFRSLDDTCGEWEEKEE